MVADTLAELVLQSVLQIRNAGITGVPGRDTEEITLEAWAESKDAAACADLVRGASRLRRGVSCLEN